MAITTTHELNMRPGAAFAPVIINLSQYDKMTDGGLVFKAKDATGDYYMFNTVTLIACRPDGVVIEIPGSVNTSSLESREKVEFELQSELTEVAGDVICEIVDSNSDWWSFGSANFILRIEPSPRNYAKKKD